MNQSPTIETLKIIPSFMLISSYVSGCNPEAMDKKLFKNYQKRYRKSSRNKILGVRAPVGFNRLCALTQSLISLHFDHVEYEELGYFD